MRKDDLPALFPRDPRLRARGPLRLGLGPHLPRLPCTAALPHVHLPPRRGPLCVALHLCRSGHAAADCCLQFSPMMANTWTNFVLPPFLNGVEFDELSFIIYLLIFLFIYGFMYLFMYLFSYLFMFIRTYGCMYYIFIYNILSLFIK